MVKAPLLGDGMSRTRLHYLLIMGAIGVYLPFINVYFEQDLGLTGRQIGLLAAVAPAMTLAIAPVWGAVADARGSRLQVLRWIIAGTAGGAVLLGLPTSFWPLLLAMGLFALFQVAIMPLSDGVTAAAAAERRISYGSVRLWGSIGFGLGAILLGQVGQRWGLRIMFPIYALLMLLALPVAWQMVPHEPPAPTGGRGSPLNLLRDRSMALFLAVAGLAAAGITAGYVFLYVFLGSLGAGPGLLGAVSAVGALAEVPMMLWSGRLIRKRGAPPVFAAGIALSGMSWGLFATLRSPELGLLIQMLNGAGTGLLLPAAVTFMAQRAPSGRIATAQSLLSAVMFGVAPLAATQLAGAVYDAAGVRVVLGVAAGIMSAGVLLLGLVNQRIWPREGKSSVERPK